MVICENIDAAMVGELFDIGVLSATYTWRNYGAICHASCTATSRSPGFGTTIAVLLNPPTVFTTGRQLFSRFSREMAVNTTSPGGEVTPPLSSSCSPWARQEQVVLEGVQYDVRVAFRGGYYHGAWVCWDCGVHGAGSFQESADHASTKAKLSLCAHHNAIHRRSRKPK
jgi:hypothetical protein